MKNTLLLSFLLLYFHSLQSQCTDSSNYWDESWVSCQKTANPNPIRPVSHWLLYEFHENHNIDVSQIWNANRTGESNMGAAEVVIDYSSDGTTWVELGTYNFPQASESNDYTGFEGPNFQSNSIKKILITVLSTHGDGICASIAEARFGINNDACNGTVDACGVCDGPGETTWYIDEDGDGLGSNLTTQNSCTQPDGYVANSDDICDDGRLGFSDITSILIDNGCNACHLSATTSGFNFGTYESFSMGGNNCGSAITTGTTFVEIIRDGGVNCSNGMVNQPMNTYASGFLDETELATIQAWIDSGAHENCEDACPGVTVEYENNNSLPSTTQASNFIRAGNLNNTGNVVVQDNQNVTFQAANYISLEAGFSVETGGIFTTLLQACNDVQMTQENPSNTDGHAAKTTLEEVTAKVYPNPFRETLTVAYVLPRDDSPVTLTLYDLSGKAVQVLINKEVQSAGAYKVNFEPCNLTEGMYLCVLEVAGEMQVVKLVKE